MRGCSLGAVPPSRACLRILLNPIAFFGLCVCSIPVSAHSITELPAPMSLSPFPVELRTWTLRNSRWIANRDVRLQALFRLFPRSQPRLGMPCPGHCLNVGIDGRTPATKILVSTKNSVIPVWPNECNLQKVNARARSAPESEVK